MHSYQNSEHFNKTVDDFVFDMLKIVKLSFGMAVQSTLLTNVLNTLCK